MYRSLILLSLASACFAQPRLPLQFDRDPGWQPKPRHKALFHALLQRAPSHLR
jgi:hypothetical protein